MNDIDPLLALSLSVQANPGVYAIFLGSGASRSAGIPTGWEVTLDLVRRVAAATKERPTDPMAWYSERFGGELAYSTLLPQLARSPAERNQVLRRYFEPTTEEQEEGLKAPRAAHKAVARLVRDGYVRVILTTNFDRIMELALQEEGIVPTVISTPDAAEGALPLIHTKCTVIKLHGDYLDARIKNTPTELARYDRRVVRLLDRVLDEFGLVIVGWSAEWDIALRQAMTRARSRRFTTFWAARGPLGDEAQRLIQLRGAVVINIDDADTFLANLQEKVESLAMSGRPHPLSVASAAETVKRYLVDDRFRIRLRELFTEETERTRDAINWQALAFSGTVTAEVIESRLRLAESEVEILQAMLIAGARWGTHEQTDILTASIERIATPADTKPVLLQDGFDMRFWPALILIYSVGIAAIAGGEYSALVSLLQRGRFTDLDGQTQLGLKLYPSRLMDQRFGRLLPGLTNHKTPASDYLELFLRPHLRELLPSDEDYQLCFDRFEFLLALLHFDKGSWAPLGCFGWRTRAQELMFKEIDTQGSDWPPLKAGFLDGSIERLQASKAGLLEFIRKTGIAW